jgi:ssDNA-binding Zn-finger/Zn-ribbon topoisomerase 1
MQKPKQPVVCEKCHSEMVNKTRNEPFDFAATTASSTLPGESASQLDYENSTESDLPEWVEYECPKCGWTTVIKVS